MERPPAPQRAHNRIYLLPLTEPGGGHDKVGSLPDLRPLQRFIEAFFDLTCKVLPYDPLLTGKLGGFTNFWPVVGFHVRPLWGVELPIRSCSSRLSLRMLPPHFAKGFSSQVEARNLKSWTTITPDSLPIYTLIRLYVQLEKSSKLTRYGCVSKNCHRFFWGVGVQVSFQLATTYHSNLGKALLLDPMGMEMIYNTMLKTAYGNFGYVFRWMASACWASPCVTCLIAHIALYIAVSQFLGN